MHLLWHSVWLACVILDAVDGFRCREKCNTFKHQSYLCTFFTLQILGETGQVLQAIWRSKYLLYVWRPFAL